jgi:phosphoribosylformylglycinamidine cyclo-ligase
LFEWLQQQGNISQDEMYRTFNCGIGMVVMVAAAVADRAQSLLTAEGEQVYRLGVIRPRAGSEAQAQVV